MSSRVIKIKRALDRGRIGQIWLPVDKRLTDIEDSQTIRKRFVNQPNGTRRTRRIDTQACAILRDFGMSKRRRGAIN